MKKIKNQLAYLLIIALTFYGLPLIDRESEMLLLWILFPLVCFFECYHLRYKIFIFFSVFHFSNGTFYSNNFYFLQ